MGFSLRHLLDDVLHPGQQQQQQQKPQPASTPAPGGLRVAAPQQNQTISVTQPQKTPLSQKLKVATTTPQNLAVGNTIIAPSPTAKVTAPPPVAQPSLAAQLLHALGHNPVTNTVGSALLKPLGNTVMGDVVLPADSLLAQATGNKEAQAIANAEAAKAQEDSLPAQIVRPFMNLGTELSYTPEAINREIHNQPITDLQQQAFGTTNPGDIGKEIAGNTGAAALTVAAPGIGRAATGAAAPAINDIVNPVAQKLATAGVRAASEAPVGAGFNVASTEANDPTASGSDVLKAAEQGAVLGGTLGAAPEAAGAVKTGVIEGTPKLVDFAKTHVDAVKSLNDNQVGAVGKDVSPTKATTTPAKTGVVDKRLQDLQDVHKQIVAAESDNLRPIHQPAAAANPVAARVRDAGGISSSAYEDVPKGVIRKAGMSADKVAQHLGYNSEDELVSALQTERDAKARTLTNAQLKEKAVESLENGKSPHTADYQKVKQMIQARQDELALYPKGTRAQVKVSAKAPKMTDEEMASLSNTPEGAKKAGNKIVKVDPKKELRNADAEGEVISKLKAGASSDDVLSGYMKKTGTTLQKAVKDVNRVAREANIDTGLGKNPLEGTIKLPKVDEGDWKQATLNARHVQAREQEIGSHALDTYKNLSAHDQVLLKDIETDTVSNVSKKADDPTAFKDAEEKIRTYYNTRHAYDTHLGLDVGYRTNYLRQLFDRVEQDAPDAGQISVRGANKRPGYTKERSFDTLGADVGNALEKDIQGSSFNHAKLAYENGLNEAYPGKIANGEIVRDQENGVYKQIDHPFGQDLSAPKDVAHEINSRVWHPNDSKALDTYDKVNRGLKYVKLSGGLFHAFTESGNFLGQQLTSGKLFTDPAATGRLAKVFFSDKAMTHEVARMADTGVLDKAHLAGLTIRPKEILADVNVDTLDKGKNVVAKYTGVQAMHDATFQREIPYAKLKIFEQKTEGLDPMKPADLKVMRQQAAAINNLFGGINREIHGIKPGTFRWLQRGLLATDFTEGKFSTLGKAIADKGAAGTTARQAVVGKALLFAVIATAGAAAGGNYTGKSKAQIAKDAAGNLVDPTFEMGGYKVGLPKTHISEVVDALKPSQNNGKAWNASGLLSYAQNRTAALPSEAIQLLSNKNYYGQPLYGTNTKKNGGAPISAPQAGENIAETVLPIPFGQAAKTARGDQNPAAAAANVIGFKASPNSENTKTFDGVPATLSDKQSEEYQTNLKNATSKVTSQLTNSDAYKKASPNDQSKALSELKTDITDATSRSFAAKYNLGQYAPNYTDKTSTATTKQQDVMDGHINPDAYVGSGDSKNNDSYAVSQFKKSDAKTKQIGDQTYYKKKDGTVTHQSTFDYTTGRQSSKLDLQLEQSKASDDYGSWHSAAAQKLALLQAQANHYDPDTESDKIDALQIKADSLVADMQKYTGYGGFTKPKATASGSKRAKSSNGIDYKIFDPTATEKSLRSLLDAARVS